MTIIEIITIKFSVFRIHTANMSSTVRHRYSTQPRFSTSGRRMGRPARTRPRISSQTIHDSQFSSVRTMQLINQCTSRHDVRDWSQRAGFLLRGLGRSSDGLLQWELHIGRDCQWKVCCRGRVWIPSANVICQCVPAP